MPVSPFYDDQQPAEGSSGDQSNPNLNVGGSAGGTVGGGGSGGQPSGPQGSGSWTNLQSYTNANKDQANTMSNQIRGNLESARAGVGEDVKQSTTAYNDYLSGQSDIVRGEQDWANSLKTGGATTPSTNEGQFSQNMDIDNWAGPATETSAFENRLASTNTERGRMEELRRLQGQQATRGESQLNQLLMQNDPQARAMFEQQKAIGAGVDKNALQAEQDLNRQNVLAEKQTAYDTGLANSGSQPIDAFINDANTYEWNLDNLKNKWTADYRPEYGTKDWNQWQKALQTGGIEGTLERYTNELASKREHIEALKNIQNKYVAGA